MTDLDFLDIGTTPARALHDDRCECRTCWYGETVSLDTATSEDLARFILGKSDNETFLANHELRAYALDIVRRAREDAPHTPELNCPRWEAEGHKGHHWYLNAHGDFICACGEEYVS